MLATFCNQRGVRVVTYSSSSHQKLLGDLRNPHMHEKSFVLTTTAHGKLSVLGMTSLRKNTSVMHDHKIHVDHIDVDKRYHGSYDDEIKVMLVAHVIIWLMETAKKSKKRAVPAQVLEVHLAEKTLIIFLRKIRSVKKYFEKNLPDNLMDDVLGNTTCVLTKGAKRNIRGHRNHTQYGSRYSRKKSSKKCQRRSKLGKLNPNVGNYFAWIDGTKSDKSSEEPSDDEPSDDNSDSADDAKISDFSDEDVSSDNSDSADDAKISDFSDEDVSSDESSDGLTNSDEDESTESNEEFSDVVTLSDTDENSDSDDDDTSGESKVISHEPTSKPIPPRTPIHHPSSKPKHKQHHPRPKPVHRPPRTPIHHPSSKPKQCPPKFPKHCREWKNQSKPCVKRDATCMPQYNLFKLTPAFNEKPASVKQI
jgi:hypothetical protein